MRRKDKYRLEKWEIRAMIEPIRNLRWESCNGSGSRGDTKGRKVIPDERFLIEARGFARSSHQLTRSQRETVADQCNFVINGFVPRPEISAKSFIRLEIAWILYFTFLSLLEISPSIELKKNVGREIREEKKRGRNNFC